MLLNTPSSTQEHEITVDRLCAIILAGGLGLRLRTAVPDAPKCMAPIAGKPFLSYVINYMRLQGVREFVFALGYKAQVIQDFLALEYPTLIYTTVTEEMPLGTGGAIALALEQTTAATVLVLNGDTIFEVDVAAALHFHFDKKAECTLNLKRLQAFNRYGVVQTDHAGNILSFDEKNFCKDGLINGGVYLLNREAFLRRSLPRLFSFENDYLCHYYKEGIFYGCEQRGYFIDIGIPEDYDKAGRDLKPPQLQLEKVDKSWTLFLDRDGVINEELPGTYVTNWEQFVFCEGVLASVYRLASRFGRVIVVTNQRGVGRGLMTRETIDSIHDLMRKQFETAGCKIDAVYYCTEVAPVAFCRKPNPGMAVQARQDFPEIDFQKSVMVGNKESDIAFARAAGMFAVYIAATGDNSSTFNSIPDATCASLAQFALDL